MKSLSLFAARDRVDTVKSFLEVLSFDELLFLAEFVGSCILASWGETSTTWEVICQRASIFANTKASDEGHKLMVLTEFAACCGVALKFRQYQSLSLV
jgi:hypothetical protein